MAANTLTVGNVEITAIHDNEGALPPSPMYRRSPGRPIGRNTRRGFPAPAICAFTSIATSSAPRGAPSS